MKRIKEHHNVPKHQTQNAKPQTLKPQTLQAISGGTLLRSIRVPPQVQGLFRVLVGAGGWGR